MDISPEVLDMVQPGKAVRLAFPPPNVNNEIRHIRAVVDDECVVFRVWLKHKKRWVYRCDDLIYYQILWREGFLKPLDT